MVTDLQMKLNCLDRFGNSPNVNNKNYIETNEENLHVSIQGAAGTTRSGVLKLAAFSNLYRLN